MIVLDNICKSFGSVVAVDGVSLTIGDGETVGITGPSGCGKTTLLRLIAGLELPDSGKILIDGKAASIPGRAIEPNERNIGFVFQQPALWPHMNVEQNILYGITGIPRQEAIGRVSELLNAMELPGLGKRRPDELSVGQARRVALARALAPRPKHLLMDEPLTNLDADLKEKLTGYIRSHVESTGASLVYVSHIPDEVECLTKSILKMNAGRIQDIKSE